LFVTIAVAVPAIAKFNDMAEMAAATNRKMEDRRDVKGLRPNDYIGPPSPAIDWR
jgi:hypothetical protein